MITEKLMEELEGESGVFSPRYLNLRRNYLTSSSEDIISFTNFEVRQMDIYIYMYRYIYSMHS